MEEGKFFRGPLWTERGGDTLVQMPGQRPGLVGGDEARPGNRLLQHCFRELAGGGEVLPHLFFLGELFLELPGQAIGDIERHETLRVGPDLLGALLFFLVISPQLIVKYIPFILAEPPGGFELGF